MGVLKWFFRSKVFRANLKLVWSAPLSLVASFATLFPSRQFRTCSRETIRKTTNRIRFWRPTWRLDRFVFLLALLASCLVLSGCASTQQIRFRKDVFASLKLLNTAATPTEKELSQRTRLTLRSFDLEKLAKSDSKQALTEIQKQVDKEPTLDLVFSVAELSFLEGRRHELLDPQLATQYYLVSSMHAFGYLFDPRFQYRRNSYDPHFREACLFYNDSVEKILRLLGKASGQSYCVDLRPESVFRVGRDKPGDFNIGCRHVSNQWSGAELEPFRFAADYEVKGLQNESRQYGLGVPLLANRKPGTSKTATTKYMPPGLCFPVTAILRFLPPNTTASDGRPLHAVIELYDPLTFDSTRILYHDVPLESDLTTPIACSISDPRIAKINTVGLVRSDLLTLPLNEVLKLKGSKDDLKRLEELDEEYQRRTIQGLYMMQPHEPGKIPVIFVHGLWSSPMAWMEMFNALRGEPELRSRYEFYFYFYPTGQPFWVSAAQFRKELDEFRNTYDPDRRDSNFDEMVLVGHSMGGLISHLQTLDSGEEFWKLVSKHDPKEVLSGKGREAGHEAGHEILDWFFFQANPSIRRVVSIASPHHGSEMSNGLTQWFGQKLIKLPQNVLEAVGLTQTNEGLLLEHSLLKTETSIESLSPGQPIFQAMETQRLHATAHYHNIIGEIEQSRLGQKLFSPGDGVVKAENARLERFDSEIVVHCEHTSIHSHPKTILEVRRILFEHLKSLDGSIFAKEPAKQASKEI